MFFNFGESFFHGNRMGTVKILVKIPRILISLVMVLSAGGLALADGPLRVGVYQNLPLIGFDKSGAGQGLLVELLAHIAEQENWTLEYVPGSWDESLTRLETGRIDLLPAIAHTPEREKQYRFSSESVISTWGQVWSRHEENIQSILDLEGKSVAVLAGDIHYLGPNGLKELAKKFSLKVNFVEFADFDGVLNAVRDGRVEAGLVSRFFSQESVGSSVIEKTTIVLNPVSVHVAFTATADPQLKTAFDNHLHQLKTDPHSYYYQLLGKWISGEEGYRPPAWLSHVLRLLMVSLAVLIAVTVFSRIQVRRSLREISRKNSLLEDEIAERRQAQKELARQTIFFEAALNSVPDGLVLCNTDREIVRCNPAMTRVFGFQPEDLLGQKTAIFYASLEEYERQGQLRFNLTAEQKSQPYVVNYRRKDGSVFPGETLGTTVCSEEGEVLGYLGVMRDITARNRSQEALQWELKVNRAMAEIGRLLLNSSSIEEISNVMLAEAKNLTGSLHGFVGFVDPRSGDLVCSTMSRDVWETCRVPDKTYVFHSFKGLWGWVLTHRQPILCNDPETDHRSTGIPGGHVAIRRFLGAPAIADGALMGVLALANSDRDYHAKDLELLERLASVYALAVQHMRAADAVRESEERFRTIFEHAGAGMNTIDIDGRFLQVNPAFCRFVGYSPEELQAFDVNDLTHPDDREMTRINFIEVQEGQRRFFDYEKRFLHRSGRVVWGYVTTAWMVDDDGRPLYGVGLVQDITERKMAETRLQENEERFKYLAHHDSLTGLPNRLLFTDRLKHAMRKARRAGSMLALLFFDLDRFKSINDSLGHDAGDQVLQAVASRLLALVREADTVARFGGDEFIVLLEDIQAVTDVETRANKILDALAKPMTVKGQGFTVTSSIGISLFPANGEDGETLIGRADDAMFRAKERGRNLFLFYDSELAPIASEPGSTDGTSLGRA